VKKEGESLINYKDMKSKNETRTWRQDQGLNVFAGLKKTRREVNPVSFGGERHSLYHSGGVKKIQQGEDCSLCRNENTFTST